jgi:hypothetical protein
MHKPEKYPIYDSYIAWLLKKYKKEFHFSNFNDETLRDYSEFIRVLNDFKTYFGLNEFSYKQLDQFLWMYAKEIKPNKYKRKE